MASKQLKCVVVGDVGESWRVLEGMFQEEGEPNVAVCTPTIGHNGCEETCEQLRPMCYPETDFFIIGFDPRNEYVPFDRVRTVFAPEIAALAPGVPVILASGLLAFYDEKAEREKKSTVSELQAEECARDIGAVYITCTSFGSLEGIAPALRAGRQAALANRASRSAAGGGGASQTRKCVIM